MFEKRKYKKEYKGKKWAIEVVLFILVAITNILIIA